MRLRFRGASQRYNEEEAEEVMVEMRAGHRAAFRSMGASGRARLLRRRRQVRMQVGREERA
jgi:hypothetical protein